MTKNKKEKKYTYIKSILIIISYFILPYLVSFVTSSRVASTCFYLIYAIVLVSLYKDVFIYDFKDIKMNWKKYIKDILISIILIFVSMVIINIIIGILFNIKETSENDFLLLNAFKENPLIVILLTCIYYPLIEGIIFRKSVRDIIDTKWLFIIFSSLFYFFFNIVYTSMNFNNIMASLCYFSTMMIVSSSYWKTNNFTISILIMSLFNLIACILRFV